MSGKISIGIGILSCIGIVTILPPDEGDSGKCSPEYQLSSRVARSATSDESWYEGAELTNTIESGIDIELFGGIDIGIDIDKIISQLLILVLILIRASSNYWYW